MARSELKPETLRKKLLASETLDEFLARMTVVWQERQRRLAVALDRQREVAGRSYEKVRAADPEGFAQRRLEAVRRYAERHPDRIREKAQRRAERRRLEREAAEPVKPLKVAKSASRATRPRTGGDGVGLVAQAVARQGDLMRAWSGSIGDSDAL